MNCVRDAKSDQMKNEQQTAVIDDQNGEEDRRTAKGSRKARRAREGLAIKQESEGPLWDSRGIEGAREYLEKH